MTRHRGCDNLSQMAAALLRLQRGRILVAALMVVVLLLGAGWAGSWACEMGGSSGCACPCGSEEPEGTPRDVAQRPSCCAPDDPTDVMVAGVVGESFESWAPKGHLCLAPRGFVSVLRSGVPGVGASRGPPQKLPVFLSHQALLL